MRTGTVKQATQILPPGQLARCRLAPREQVLQVNFSAVRGRPRTVRNAVSGARAMPPRLSGWNLQYCVEDLTSERNFSHASKASAATSKTVSSATTAAG